MSKRKSPSDYPCYICEGRCPECGGDHIEWDDPDPMDCYLSRDGICLDCACLLTEHSIQVYEVTTIRETTEDE
jgi:hypothetical protein